MKPTLEEVKAYFKNAKEVKCLSENRVFKLKENYSIERGILTNSYFAYKGGKAIIDLWDDQKGYAEIISYKEFTVSKEFILEAHSAACSTWKTKIEDKFPDLFNELTPFNWYRPDGFGKCLLYFTGEYGYRKSPFGFDYNGNYTEKLGVHREDRHSKATDEEVFEMFAIEADKRGYKSNTKIKSLLFKGTTVSINGTEMRLEGNGRRVHMGGSTIFDNGEWAEIVPKVVEMTKEEIEQKLGFKIKIV
jgi:hypothetical protein